MDLGLGPWRTGLCSEAPAEVILLDTNALLWLDSGHKRSRPLAQWLGSLYVSPASLLEVQLLVELGRIRLRVPVADRLLDDDRWLLDDPASGDWFSAALGLSWTRDPFDRLLVAHARLRRWRLATGDRMLLERLAPAEHLEL